MILLVEWGNIIVLHVRHAFWSNFWRSLPNDDVKSSYLKVWPKREPAAVNPSFFAFAWKRHWCQANESAPRLFCTTWPTWNNRKTLNLTQSSILMWRFRCSSRRSFLNSLLIYRYVYNYYTDVPSPLPCPTGLSPANLRKLCSLIGPICSSVPYRCNWTTRTFHLDIPFLDVGFASKTSLSIIYFTRSTKWLETRLIRDLQSTMDNLRAPLSLCFKASLGAKFCYGN